MYRQPTSIIIMAKYKLNNLYSASTFSLKLPSRMERTYNKTFICTPVQKRCIIFRFLGMPITWEQMDFTGGHKKCA